ncbi:MAG: MarR family transcriptional regulator [Deltaproteobacteria bacterium]|nr:MarR family transcriptional regulator [Deltaproteobacteria bacterium]
MQARSAPWDSERFLAFWINHTSRKLLRMHDARLRELGIGMAYIPVLMALDERGPLSQKDLVAAARVEQPTMVQLLARMERDGLIRRPEVQRGGLFELTRLARTRVAQARDVLVRGEQQVVRGISEEEKATLIALLKRVAANTDGLDS